MRWACETLTGNVGIGLTNVRTGGGNGSNSATEALGFQSTGAGLTGNGILIGAGSQTASATFSQSGTTSTGISVAGVAIQTIDNPSVSQQGNSSITMSETGTLTLSSTGLAVNVGITQTVTGAATSTYSDTGTMLITGPGAAGTVTSSNVSFGTGQSSGSSGSSTIITNLSQSGMAFSASGTFDINGQGNNSGYYKSTNNYSTGTSSAGATYGTEVYSESGSGSYSAGLQGAFNGSSASGTYNATENSTSGTDDTITETVIATSPTGGGVTSYSVESSSGTTLDYQLSESFTPTGASGTDTLTQWGNNGSSENDTETYTQTGGMLLGLPGGVWQVTTTDSGQGSVTATTTASYFYQITDSFTPTSDNGTLIFTDGGTAQSSSGNGGVLTGTGYGAYFSDGYTNSVVQSSGYAYTNNGTYTDSGGTGVATLTEYNGAVSTSSAAGPFSTSVLWILTGTLSSGGSTSSGTISSSTTNYSPSTTNVTFSENITGNVSTGVSNNYTGGTAGGGANAYNGASSSTDQTTNTTSGTIINGTTVAGNTYNQSGSSGYTDNMTSSTVAYNVVYSSVASDADTSTWNRSAVTNSTTGPGGSVVTMNETFGSSLGNVYSGTDSTLTFNAITQSTGLTNDWSSDYTTTETYNAGSSDQGNVSESGSAVTEYDSFSLTQNFTDNTTTNAAGLIEVVTSLSMWLGSTSIADSTNSTQTYSDSGTMSSSGAGVTVSDSTEYIANASRSSCLSTSGSTSASGWSTSGVGTDTETMSSSATQTVSPAVSSATYGIEGTISIYEDMKSGSGAGATETIANQTMSWTTTVSFSGGEETYSYNQGVSSSVTTIVDGTASTISGSGPLVYNASGPDPLPSISLLQEWAGVPSGSGGSTGSSSGAWGSSAGGGSSGSAFGSSSGSFSGSSGFAGSSSSSSSSSPSSPGSINGGSLSTCAIQKFAQWMPQTANGGVYVPGGVMTLPGSAISSGAGVSNAEQAGLVEIANGQAGAQQLPPLPKNVFAQPPMGVTGAQKAYEKQQIAAAIAKIQESDYAKTEDGKEILALIKAAQAAGTITFVKFADPEMRGGTPGGKALQVKVEFLSDPDSIASELVHEAGHLVFKARYDQFETTVDEEHFATENQLMFYRNQKKGGFVDLKLEERLGYYETGGLTAYIIRRSIEKGVPLKFADDSWALWFRRIMIQQAEQAKAGWITPPIFP